MVRVSCYYDCIHVKESHCFVKGGNIALGRHKKRNNNKRASCCIDYQEG